MLGGNGCLIVDVSEICSSTDKAVRSPIEDASMTPIATGSNDVD